MKQSANPWHPDLRASARFFPKFNMTPRLLRVMRFFTGLMPGARPPAGVTIENVNIPGPEKSPAVRVRIYRSAKARKPTPALIWIHGGGYVLGRPEMDDDLCLELVQELGIAIFAVDYRLAPEHPFPAPLEDCYAALHWVFNQADALGVDAKRIAIGGASAGGGLTAALAQLTHDRGEHRLVLQLLVYPMLDDRTTGRTDFDNEQFRGWNQPSNIFGWRAYLGKDPNGADAPKHSVPSRREDLAGLPPAWLGVGTCDLFHDEDLAYAERLQAAGVPCELLVVPGGFHAFDRIRSAPVARDFSRAYTNALRKALSST